MPRIAIITDTDASLPRALADKHHIRQVPIVIQFGDQSLLTDNDLDDAQLFARIDRDGKLPTTSAPSPGQFVTAFQAAFDEGADHVICFNVSSAISATYAAAVNARNLLPDRDITVIDTQSLSLGQGFMAIAAAEAAHAGAAKEECIARAQDVGQRAHVFAALSTLKYLAMSGRVGAIAAGMAGLLNIKPILTIRDGKLEMLEKVRTQKKSWARVLELADGIIAGQAVEQLAIVHVAAPEAAREFEKMLRVTLNCPPEVLIAELTPGLSVHTGSGLVGLAFVSG
ncbi:MAG: DegV family protein [Thermoflexales bacterium]|nr:DegV family protein [Thermoflexales bacterium]